MNEQKVTMLVTAQINPEEKQALAHYAEISGALFKSAGAVIKNKYTIENQIIGNNAMNLISIVEFPNEDVLTRVFNDEAYKALFPLRELAFLKLEAYVSKA